MSREAQAAREKQARIILGQAEMEIAHSFQEAAQSYHDNPTALHLRAMNMLYEGLKEKGALMLIPSSAVESMGMGGMMGAAAMRQSTLTVGTSRFRSQSKSDTVQLVQAGHAHGFFRDSQRRNAMEANTPDRMSMCIWLMLAVLGAVLASSAGTASRVHAA